MKSNPPQFADQNNEAGSPDGASLKREIKVAPNGLGSDRLSKHVLGLRDRATDQFRAGQPDSLESISVELTVPTVDPWQANAVVVETEPMRAANGRSVVSTECLTILLASMRCPLTCVMCDLWKRTLSHPTPNGAIAYQVRKSMSAYTETRGTLKLYNAGNFFDPRATPERDLLELAELGSQFDRVVVENHPRFGWSRLVRFAERLGSRLEVAVGLESVAPQMLARLNKQLTRDRFADHAKKLREHHVGLRVFLIVGLPWHSPDESIRWAKLSALFAARTGANHITFLACRSGNGFMDSLEAEGVFRPPTLTMMAEVLEWALSECRVSDRSVVTVDTWGLDAIASCADCVSKRMQQIEDMNQSQSVVDSPTLACHCGQDSAGDGSGLGVISRVVDPG